MHRPRARIQVLSTEVIDRIAAGEVVERPASVVRELCENALDAGASRVVVELEDAGISVLRVVDDGCGILPEDLPLALLRHATSKIRGAEDLSDVRTLGFRGEALASIAAVARLSIRSRTADAEVGASLLAVPGEPVEMETVGMPVGTQVEVSGLFAALPARRKFLRSEATEIRRTVEVVLALAVVHHHVHFVLKSGGRELVRLPAATRDGRVGDVLLGRGGGALWPVSGREQGILVQAWLAPPERAAPGDGSLFVVVRGRVVREPRLRRIVVDLYGDDVAAGRRPLACIAVEPPEGMVDVNVHPQKTEVRFADAQSVYAAVRRVLAESWPSAPWAARAAAPWPLAPLAAPTPPAADRAYSLVTRAMDRDYDAHKRAIREGAERLRADEPVDPRSDAQERGLSPEEPFELLTCLPGPVALFRHGDVLLAADLRALRSHLLRRRLLADLGGPGIAAQSLLAPVILNRTVDDVRLCAAARDDLARLGLDVEPFADDALIVRAVPADLRQCLDDAEVGDLVDRIVPWLRLRERDRSSGDLHDGAAAMARANMLDPAPRLARRWLAELWSETGSLEGVEGIRMWRASDLLKRNDGRT